MTISLLAIMTSIFFPMLAWLIAKSSYLQYQNEASSILQEGIESTYNILQSDWDGDYAKYSEFTADSPIVYHNEVNSGVWALATGPETGVKGRFNKEITFTKICRNKINGKTTEGITGCSGDWAWDKNSKLIKCKVTWREKGYEKEVNTKLLMVKI